MILLGADSPIGLTVVRELGRWGVQVHCLAASADAIGLRSRYAASTHVRETDEDGLIEQLRELSASTGCRWLMTVGEADIMRLQRRREDLAPLVPLVPDPEPFQRVLDKAETAHAARKVGIDVPRAWDVDGVRSLAQQRDEFRFPVILKWRNPHRLIGALNRHGERLEKYRYIYEYGELERRIARLEALGELPLILEYASGQGLGQMLFMHRGRALYRFQHRRIAEWPPEGGASAVCESLPATDNEELFERSIALLRELGWEGAAMVEYRYDAETGRALLMEVNGRFWGSLPLAYHSGAYFVFLTFAAAALQAIPELPPYRAGVRARYVIPEFKRLLRITFAPHRIQNRELRFSRSRVWFQFLAGYCRPATRYYVFQWRDPAPFFKDMSNVVGKAARSVVRRMRG